MTERRQFVGHTSTAEADQFTGLSREITVDMQAETLRVHDGNTPGGFPLMRADMANLSESTLNSKLSVFQQASYRTGVINEYSTEFQYPNAKAVYQQLKANHFVGDIKASLQKSNHGLWLLCNGQAVSRTKYASLFNLIGVSFGNGDGVTTFNLPDYRGKFLRGLGGNSAANFATTQKEGLPNITGNFGIPDDRSVFASGAFSASDVPSYNSSDVGGSGKNIRFDASRSSSVYGASNHVTPINQAVNYFIYAG